MAEVPELPTDRLILRGHRREDFADSAAMWAEPGVVKYIMGSPSTHEQSWARLQRYLGMWALSGFGFWVVTRREDGEFLGEVGLADFQRDTQPQMLGDPEAGWVLKTSAHGKGLATEAVQAVMAWCDENVSAPHVNAMFDPAHKASMHVAEKVGFTFNCMGHYGELETLFMRRPRAWAPA